MQRKTKTYDIMFVRSALLFLLLNLTGVMLHKLKNDEIDEIEIPENPNPNQSLFVCLLLVCTYPNLQMFVSYKPENGELSKFFSSHRFKGQGPN